LSDVQAKEAFSKCFFLSTLCLSDVQAKEAFSKFSKRLVFDSL